jgi:hypothetical protein
MQHVHTVATPSLETVPFDEERWRQWLARGRAADVRFRSFMRTCALIGTATAIVGAALWTMG